MPKLTDVANILYTTAETKNKVPNLLWHYTNAAGLIGIAKTRSLWCSESRFLNDHEEISYFAQHFVIALAKALHGRISQADLEKIVKGSYLYPATYGAYVCSFCSEGDNDKHWFHYARKAGYSLGFEPAQLRSRAEMQGFVLAPVIYGADAVLGFSNSYLQDNRSILEGFNLPFDDKAIADLSQWVGSTILLWGGFFKSSYFSFEREWRLLRITNFEEDESGVMFRQNEAFGLIGYRELTLNDNKSLPSSLIKEIKLGPGNESGEFRAAVNVYNLFLKNGFTTNVFNSKSAIQFKSLRRRPSKIKYRYNNILVRLLFIFFREIWGSLQRVYIRIYFAWIARKSDAP